jgi:hypothetical protein
MLLSFDVLDDLLGLGSVVRCAERGPTFALFVESAQLVQHRCDHSGVGLECGERLGQGAGLRVECIRNRS